jgi:uncharacterized membrane protein
MSVIGLILFTLGVSGVAVGGSLLDSQSLTIPATVAVVSFLVATIGHRMWEKATNKATQKTIREENEKNITAARENTWRTWIGTK